MLNKRKDGSAYYVKTVVVPLLDEQQNIKNFLSIRQDITDIVKARQTIKLQTTDLLTGLPNRVHLADQLKKQQCELLAMFDVRNFKLLNDVYGMEQGDLLIKKLAQFFRDYCHYMGLAPYRINGATFALMPTAQLTMEAFVSRCEKLKSRLETQCFSLNEQGFDLSFSIGVGLSASHTLALAESALIEAKMQYSQQTVVKTDQDLTSGNAFLCIDEVRRALAEDRLTAVFQKLAYINPEAQSIAKFEALVRIDKGEGELISPGAFLTHIKKTRFYGELTRQMITLAVNTANQIDCVISVNLSIQDILDEKTKQFIYNKLHEYGGANIIFEITESEAIQDFDSVADFIKQVRRFGSKIAIDDFGSGYSNFAYLVDIKPDYIKIDGAIIKGIVQNDNCRLVTKSIIDMARSLNIKTIAEFVSEQGILDRLTELNVDMVQGFHIGKPLSLEELYKQGLVH